MRGLGLYFDSVVVQRDTHGMVTVLVAPWSVGIAPELYEQACAGECEHLDAGEGLFAIKAENGTFRYRLTGEVEKSSGALMAAKIPGRHPAVRHAE